MDDPFPTTQWSELFALRAQGDEGARLALAHLYERYWPALYAYLRRRGRDPEWAEDILQGFFAQLLDRETVATLDLSGKLRAFLLASLKNYIVDEFHRENARKRRPEQPLLSLDVEVAEAAFRRMESKELTPEQVYEQRWAMATVESAARSLAEQERAKGQADAYALLAPHVVGGVAGLGYREIAERLEASESAIKVRVHRLRKRLGELVRAEVEMGAAPGASVRGEVFEMVGTASP